MNEKDLSVNDSSQFVLNQIRQYEPTNSHWLGEGQEKSNKRIRIENGTEENEAEEG